MKSLVTGGAGFIGSNLVDELLNLGHEVIVIDDESAECHDQFYWNIKASNHKVDVCNFEEIKNLFKGVDYVFHLASDARIQPSIKNPYESVQKNVMGTLNVLELSRINNVKSFVFSSTSSLYSNLPTPNIETQKPNPMTPYSVGKLTGESLCKVYYELYGVKTISLRYFNVYGPNQPLKGKYAPVVGLFLKQYFNNESLTIVGSGEQSRSFTHVSDIVKANILMALGNFSLYDYGQVFNVGFEKSFKILDLAKMISDNHKFIEERSGESSRIEASVEKLWNLLNWKPTINIEDWIIDAKS